MAGNGRVSGFGKGGGNLIPVHLECGGISLDVIFTSPAVPTDLDLVSAPYNYVTYQAKSLDGKEHEVQVYLEMREELVGGQHDIFFVTDKGRPIYGQFVYRLVRKVLADDVSLERRSPHVLRHTFATHLLNNGASIEGIKDLLGHASVGTTQVYAHNTVERMKKIFNQAHPRA